jgi:hypothetical protein
MIILILIYVLGLAPAGYLAAPDNGAWAGSRGSEAKHRGVVNGKKTPQGKRLRPRFEEGWPFATHVSRLTLERPSLVCPQLRTLRETS